MDRAFYSSSIADFLTAAPQAIVDALAGRASTEGFPPREAQVEAWRLEVEYLQLALVGREGTVYFEFSIPRMGLRIDVVIIIGPVIFVVEFKVGAPHFERAAFDQVWDYALDLKNFHSTSHRPLIAPILVATEAENPKEQLPRAPSADGLLDPLRANLRTFTGLLDAVIESAQGGPLVREAWEEGHYRPTPTIIEAALALYRGHSVAEITRSDAGSINLSETSEALSKVIREARKRKRKAICFITGVPGAGKTLVGLNVATQFKDETSELHSVYLSGNGPLVAVLREALARDQVARARAKGEAARKSAAMNHVKAFIQNVHNFRDECLTDLEPPHEHVAIFDEAQRAWTKEKTALFMKRRRKGAAWDHDRSEPDFLISCLDRHPDWAVVVCLVGGGQEIHTGEAGIGEWIAALQQSYPSWDVHISSRLVDTEYAAGGALDGLDGRSGVERVSELHLATSMRSFRAENVSNLVKQLLDTDVDGARQSLTQAEQYPIALTRDLRQAKRWVREHARGTERYGLVASSQAERLKPHAIAVKAPVDPVHWFLDEKEDVRSSFYLEDAATEFHVQGLELDWTCVTWDADLRHDGNKWDYWSFKGKRWERIRSEDRKRYLKNAYRVLLTRARQGMVIVVPDGDQDDPTRSPGFYDPTFDYLERIGLKVI